MSFATLFKLSLLCVLIPPFVRVPARAGRIQQATVEAAPIATVSTRANAPAPTIPPDQQAIHDAAGTRPGFANAASSVTLPSSVVTGIGPVGNNLPNSANDIERDPTAKVTFALIPTKVRSVSTHTIKGRILIYTNSIVLPDWRDISSLYHKSNHSAPDPLHTASSSGSPPGRILLPSQLAGRSYRRAPNRYQFANLSSPG